MLIGSGSNSIITTDAYGLDGEYDIDSLAGILNFNLPYILKDQQQQVITSGIDITKLKKFDTVKLYYGELAQDVTIDLKAATESTLTSLGLTKLFDGFVDTVKLSKSKSEFTYQIGALGTAALSNYRTLEWQKKNDLISNMVKVILNLSGLTNQVPFKSSLTREIAIDIDGGKVAKDFLMQIREKYAVILHQGPDGILRLSTSEIFAQGAATVAWNFDFRQGNVFDLDYGDLTNNYNAVLCLGFPPNFGIALDAIGSQNAGGVSYFPMTNFDLKSNEDCEAVARNKLLELERNFSITFKTKLDPRFAVGQCFTMKDYDKYTGSERFLIKKFAYNIDKNDVSATITGYTHSLTIVPESIVLSNTGIADIYILELRPKVTDSIGWNCHLGD